MMKATDVPVMTVEFLVKVIAAVLLGILALFLMWYLATKYLDVTVKTTSAASGVNLEGIQDANDGNLNDAEQNLGRSVNDFGKLGDLDDFTSNNFGVFED